MIDVYSSLNYKINVTIDNKKRCIAPGKNSIVNSFADSPYAKWSCFSLKAPVVDVVADPVEPAIEVPEDN